MLIALFATLALNAKVYIRLVKSTSGGHTSSAKAGIRTSVYAPLAYIEDERLLADSIVALLKGDGYQAEAVYDGGWYMFNNIREIAMQADELSSSRTYTLMDTQSFGYAVYDDASNQVKMVKAFYSIDEEDPNNCWVVKSQAGKKYLYNIGARKYARIGIDGKISLTSLATPVSLSEGDGGIVIDADLSRQWGFVKNNTITDVTGIEAPTSDKDDSGSIYYSLDGQRKESPRKGVNIMKMNDGTIKKVIVK